MPDAAPVDVDLWLADPADERLPALHAAHEALLDETERARRASFHFEHDRDRYLLTRALVRCVLGERVGRPPQALAFDESAHGKPALRQEAGAPGLAFNVSHTRGLVVLAVTGGPTVGVDVEDTQRRAPLAVAHRFFSAGEREALAALPPPLQARRFWALWTLKESYVKALGKGLLQPLSSFGFGLDDAGAGIAFTAPEGIPPQGWWFGSWQASPTHVLALCVGQGAGEGAGQVERGSASAAGGPVRTPRVHVRSTLPLLHVQETALELLRCTPEAAA